MRSKEHRPNREGISYLENRLKKRYTGPEINILLKKEKKQHHKERERNAIITTGILTVFFVLSFLAYNLITPTPTGLVITTTEETQQINLKTTESQNITLEITQPDYTELTSIRSTAIIKGTGTALIQLVTETQTLTILNTTNTKTNNLNDVCIQTCNITGITDKNLTIVITLNGTEIHLKTIDYTIKQEQTTENISINETINATQNITTNITENISANITENISINITENITLNITQNITENISANITENLSINITENISLNITENISINITENITFNISENISLNITNITVPNITTNLTDNITNITPPTNLTINITENITLNITENISLNITENITQNITENTQPTLTRQIPNQTTEQNSILTLDLSTYFTDPDNDTLTYTAQTIADIALNIAYNVLTITTNDTYAGTAHIEVYASDNKSTTNTSFMINISLIEPEVIAAPETKNNAPDQIKEISEQILESNMQTTLDLSQYFKDEDNDSLSYNLQDKEGITAEVTNESLNIDTTNSTKRQTTIRLTATDGIDDANTNVRITILPEGQTLDEYLALIALRERHQDKEHSKKLHFKNVTGIDGRYSVNITFNETIGNKKGHIKLHKIINTNNIIEVQTKKPNRPNEDRITTEIIAANIIEQIKATITLPKTGRVSIIMRCDTWDFTSSECSSWTPTNIPFTQNSTHIMFNASGFSGYGGANITVLNVQSYPAVGGNWTVDFTTMGIANLTITAINETTFGTSAPNDLEWKELRCGEDTLDPDFNGSHITFKDYYCNATSQHISFVMTPGKHNQMLQFGEAIAYANNYASTLNITGTTELCGDVTAYDRIIVQSGGVLKVCEHDGTATTGYANITLGINGNFTVLSGGKVYINGSGGMGGAGNTSSSGSWQGTDGNSSTAGSQATTANGGGGGGGDRGNAGVAAGGGSASFGGTAGISSEEGSSTVGAPGAAYGTASSSLLYIGSGGGGGTGDTAQSGGRGGGGLRVHAHKGQINIYGEIHANGTNGTGNAAVDCGGSGAGSGGHIILQAAEIDTTNGKLYANGGTGGGCPNGDDGCGAGGAGGGRIIIQYETFTNTSMTYSVAGGAAGAMGGGCDQSPAAGGTGTYDIEEQTFNYKPNTPTPQINSTSGSNETDQDLNCNATIYDPEGDDLNVTVKWYKDSVLDTSQSFNNSYNNGTLFNATLDKSLTSAGIWNCSIRLDDGKNFSNWANSSNLNITDPCAQTGNWEITSDITCDGSAINVNNLTITNSATATIISSTMITNHTDIDVGATLDIRDSNNAIWMNGNLTIGGTYKLNASTLRINGSADGTFGITLNNTGKMIIANSSNITNGNTLAAEFFFIVKDASNFTMTDSNVSEAGWAPATGQYGLEINTTAIKFRNNTLTNNYYAVTFYTNNNNIINNTANDNIYGITISGGTNNNISGSSTAGNLQNGIFLTNSANNNRVINNTANTDNYGIYINSQSNNNIIANNTANIATTNGIYIANSHNNTITNNSIYLSGSDGIMMSTNQNSTIKENTINTSGQDGIDLIGARNNTIKDNTILNSTSYGIYIRASTNNNTIKNNTIKFNANGIQLSGANNNLITGNRIANHSNNIWYGGNANTIDNNKLNNASYSAFYMDDGTNPLLTNNQMTNNSYGIWSDAGYGGVAINNTITDISKVAIYLDGSDNWNFTDTYITNCNDASSGICIQMYSNNFNFTGGYINNSADDILYLGDNRNTFKDLRLINATTNVIGMDGSSYNHIFLNVTYNTSQETLGAGENLTRQWYYRAYVSSGGSPIDAANINISNRTGDLQYTLNTDATGHTRLTNLTDYINHFGNRWYFSNYTINASKTGYQTTTKTWNITNVTNIYNDTFAITSDAGGNSAPDTPTPLINSTDGTNTTTTDLNCNATVSDTDGNDLNVTVRWFLNGTINLSQNFNNNYADGTLFNATLGRTNTTVGDNWSCAIKVNDTTKNSSWGYSVNLTIIDTAKPNVTLNSPTNATNTSTTTQNFNCTATDDYLLSNITLYWNYTGTWTANGTANTTLATNTTNFSRTSMVDGDYIWNCKACDTSDNCNFSTSNYTLTIDTTNPVINLDSPGDSNWSTTIQNTFRYTATDATLLNCSLWGDFNGSWTQNKTNLTTTSGSQATVSMNLSNGTYTWNVRCYDEVGKIGWNNSNHTLYVDSVKPNITVHNPTSNKKFNASSDNVTFNWTVNDNIDTSLICNLTLDSVANQSNIAATNGTPVNFTANKSAAGSHTWTLTCWDSANNTNSTGSRTYIINTVPTTPSPIINSTDNTNTTYQDLNCNATISDPEADPLNVTVRWYLNNTQNYTTSYNNSYANNTLFNATLDSRNTSVGDNWACAIRLSDGYDYSGWGWSENITITDRLAPNVTLNSPANSTNTSTTTQNFNCTATDDYLLSNITLYWNYTGTWTSNGTNTASLATNTTNFSRTSLADGDYIWNCEACDTSGNCNFSTSNYTITIDTANPVVNLESPGDGNWSTSIQNTFRYTATDTNLLNCSLWGDFNGSWTQNKTNLTPTSGSQATVSMNLSNGTYLWNVRCYDEAGNIGWNNSNDTLYVDSEKTSITLLAISNNINTTNTSINLNWTATDNLDTSLTCNLTINDTVNVSNIAVTNGTAYNRTVERFQNGTYNWNVTCWDSANNTNTSATRNFTIDNLGPGFFETLVNESYGIASKAYNFSTGARDKNVRVHQIWFSHNFTINNTENETADTADKNINIGKTQQQSQSFQFSSDRYVYGACWYGRYKKGTAGDLYLNIYATTGDLPTGSRLARGTISSATLSESYELHCTNLTKAVLLKAATTYALTASSPDSSSTGTYQARRSNAEAYALGRLGKCNNANCDTGIGWNLDAATRDMYFTVMGGDFYWQNLTPTTINAAEGNVSTVQTTVFARDQEYGYCWYSNDTMPNQNQTCDIFFVSEAPDTVTPQPVNWTKYTIDVINGDNATFAGFARDESYLANISIQMMNETNPFEILYTNSTASTTITLEYRFNTTPYKNNRNLTFRLMAMDFANNVNYSTNVTVRVDHAAPILSSFPATNPWVTPNQVFKDGKNITLRTNVTDGAGSGMNYVEVDLSNVNGSSWTNMSLESGSRVTGQYAILNLTVTVSNAPTGKHSIIMHHVDNASPSNSINYSITIDIDNSEPYAEQVNTTPPPNYNNSNVTYTAHWYDNESDIAVTMLDTCNLTTNSSGSWVNYNKTLSGEDDTCSFSINHTIGGIVTWIMYANDSKGNLGNSSWRNITIYPIPTANITKINLTSPVNNSVEGSTITFKYNVTNISQVNLSSCWIIIDGSINTTNTSPLINISSTFTITGFTNESYEWSIDCNNTDNIIGSSDDWYVNVSADGIKPTITLNSPADNAYTFNSTVKFNWTTTDNNATTPQCNITINSTINSSSITVTNNTPYNLTVAGFTNGNYTWNITCWDDEGNVNTSATRAITVDLSAPTIDFISSTPTNASSESNNYIYVNISTTDNYEQHTTILDWNNTIAAWYMMDFYNTTGIHDNSTNDNFAKFNGTLAPENTTEGKYGKGLSLDGTEDYLNITQSTELDITTDATFTTWFKLNEPFTATSTKTQIIIEKYKNDNNNFLIALAGTDYTADSIQNGSIVMKIESGTSESRYKWTKNTSWTADTWYHLTIVLNKTDGNESKIYVNGNDITNTSTNGEANETINFSTDIHMGGLFADTNDLTPPNASFNGTLDNIIIYSRALSPDEINASYNANTYQYAHNHTNLTTGTYTFKASTQDQAGNTNNTEERTVTISTTCAPSGDWTITTNETCTTKNLNANDLRIQSGTTLTLINTTLHVNNTIIEIGGTMIIQESKNTIWQHGNLTINGQYTLNGSTLRMNATEDGELGILVNTTGNMTVINASNITNGTGSGKFFFIVRSSSNFTMIDSNLSYVGWSTTTGTMGLEINTSGLIFTNNTLNNNEHGIVLHENAKNTTITGNRITNNNRRAIYLLETDRVNITNNTIVCINENPCLHINGADNIIVRNSNISHTGSASNPAASKINNNANNNTFINVNFSSSNSHAIWFSTGTNNSVIDSTTTATGDHIRQEQEPGDINYIINTTFNKVKGVVVNGKLVFSWYLDIQINQSDTTQISGANVSLYNVTGEYITSGNTNSSGGISFNVTEYTQNSSQKYPNNVSYWTNYTINISKSGYAINSTKINISESKLLNFTLESNPNVTLTTPTNNTNITSSTVDLQCNVTNIQDLDNITLYGNWSGSWTANQTKNISATTYIANFTIILRKEGNYIWNCKAYNNQSNRGWANSNYTFVLREYNFTYLTNSTTTTRFSYLNGTFNKTYFNESNRSIELENGSYDGNFTSQIFDLTLDSTTYSNISWTSSAYGELPSDTTKETTFTSGNANMTGNVLLMRFNNDSNHGENETYIYDYSGQGNVGNCSGTVCPSYTYSDQKLGRAAFDFDGTDDYIRIENDTSLNPTAITVSAWVKWNSLTATTTCGGSSANINFIVFKKNSRAANYEGYMLGKRFDDTLLFAVAESGGTQTGVNSSYDAKVGRWYHLVGTFERPNIKLYVDGIQVDSDSHNFDLDYGIRPVFIGRAGECGKIDELNFDTYIDAVIDEVAIWNRSFTAQEIKDLYKRGATRLNISVRSCDDSVCSGESFIELNDTSPQNLTLNGIPDNRYFQYMCIFNTTNLSYTPALHNVTIKYLENNPPTTPTPLINSTDGTNGSDQDLNCNATISDANSDIINVTVHWYLNGSFNLTLSYNNSYSSGTLFNATLDSGNTSKGDNWGCRIRLDDGEYLSGWGNSSNITITNRIPTTNPTNITPEPAYTNDTLLGWCNATDPDNDTINYHWEWYKDGVLNIRNSTLPAPEQDDTEDEGSFTGTCDDPGEAYDENWITAAGVGAPSSTCNIFVNYTIPSTARNAINEINTTRDGASATLTYHCYNNSASSFTQFGTSTYSNENVSIPTDCLDSTKLQLRYNLNSGPTNDITFYEEKMWWNSSTVDPFQGGIEVNVHNLSSGNTSKGENWTFSCLANDKTDNATTWMNYSVVISNLAPTAPTLYRPEDGNETIHDRTPSFTWNNSNDTDGDSINYSIWITINRSGPDFDDPIIIFHNITEAAVGEVTNYTNDTILNLSVIYFWKVRAWDGTNYSANSSVFNFTIEPYLDITMLTNNTSFGDSIGLGTINSTLDDLPPPLTIENNGNVFANISINASNLWVAQPNPSAYYLYKVNVSEAASYDSALTATWYNLNQTSYNISITNLNWTNATDSAEIEIYIEVPDEEPSGPKSSMIWVTGE